MSSPQVYWPYITLLVFTILAFAANWREFWQAHGLDRTFPLGRVSIAIPMAVFGADHLTTPHAIATMVPAWIPWKLFWAYFVGFALFAAALSISVRVKMRLSSALLGFMLFCFVVLIDVPATLGPAGGRYAWTLTARDSSFSAGAILLAIACARGRRSAAENSLAAVAYYWIAVVSVFFGVRHFLQPQHVPAVPLNLLVPAWIPLGSAWTILTGCLLVAGGLAMLAKNIARRVAAALGVWVLLLVYTLYLAIMIAKHDVEGVNYFTDTMVFGGVLLMAAQWRAPGVGRIEVEREYRAAQNGAEAARAASAGIRPGSTEP